MGAARSEGRGSAGTVRRDGDDRPPVRVKVIGSSGIFSQTPCYQGLRLVVTDGQIVDGATRSTASLANLTDRRTEWLNEGDLPLPGSLACGRVSFGRLRHGELVLHGDAETPFFIESGGS